MGETPLGERIAALEVHLQHVMAAIRDADARQEERLRHLETRLIERLEDHERRLRTLERWHYRVSGWAAAIASVVTVVWQIVLRRWSS